MGSTPKSSNPKKGTPMEIELKTMTMPFKKPSPTRVNADLAGSIHFSFVSLDNIIVSGIKVSNVRKKRMRFRRFFTLCQ